MKTTQHDPIEIGLTPSRNATMREQDVRRLGNMLNELKVRWYECGKLAVSLSESDPDFIEAFCSAYPEYNEFFFKRLLEVGREQLDPDVFTAIGTPGGRALSRLPIRLQAEWKSKPVIVCKRKPAKRDGYETTIIESAAMDFRQLTPAEAKLVFNGNSVRSEAEQSAILRREDERNAKPLIDAKPVETVRIEKRRLVVLSKRVIEVPELIGYLGEMKLSKDERAMLQKLIAKK